MTWLPQRSRIQALVILTIAAFLFFLGFTSSRLVQVDRELRKGGGESLLWLTSQAQYEGTLFAESLARRLANLEFERDQDQPVYRFDIFMSRIDTLFGGPLEHMLERFGVRDKIKEHYARLIAAEPLIRSGPLTTAQVSEVRSEVAGLVRVLRDASNRFVSMERDERGSARDTFRRIIFEIIVSVIGVQISGGLLVFRLFRGIRETKKAERLLRQEKELSDLVINLSDQGIVILDRSLTGLLWNPGMEALLGVPASEVVGRPLDVAVPLFASSAISTAFSQAINGVSTTVEDENVPPDLRPRCLEISCHPLRISERDLVIAFVRDVTVRWEARKRAERHNVDLEKAVEQRTAALRQAESRLIAAISTAPDGFAVFDAEGRLLIANERIRSVEPVASSFRNDMSLSSFLACFAPCEGADRGLLAAGGPFDSIELELRLQSESWAHLSVSRVDGGTIFVRLTDVTPYKKAALALQSSLDRERETTNAYRSFVSMVSHEFRTPLAIVDSSAQRLLRRGAAVPPEELASRVQKIRNATGRLTNLVDGVLNVAKLDAGQSEPKFSACDLVELVAEVCDSQRELSPQIDIRFEAPKSPVEVSCDGMLIEQAVCNLLSNAVKYSGGNSVVEVRITKEGEGVSCSIRDWGIGIPAEETARVFDRFYRARTAVGIAGTGIGLNLSRQIMQMHGGDIRVESREGEGSTFTLTLPAANAGRATQAA